MKSFFNSNFKGVLVFVLLWSGPVSGQEISVFRSTNDYGEALVKLSHPVIKSISKEGENIFRFYLKVSPQDFSICFRFQYRQTKEVDLMFNQWKVEMSLRFEHKTFHLNVKPHDQILQPENASSIPLVRAMNKTFLYFIDFFCLKNLLTPFEWHSFCLTVDSRG